MSWSRRGVLLGGALALAACGFSPVYAPGGAGSKLFGQIRAADPKTPDEFTFAGRIADWLGTQGYSGRPQWDPIFQINVGVLLVAALLWSLLRIVAVEPHSSAGEVETPQ